MQEIENSDVSMISLIYKNIFGSANTISPISVSDNEFYSEYYGSRERTHQRNIFCFPQYYL